MVFSLERLVQSSLTIDWNVVGFGWHQHHLIREDLLTYAMDQIGYAPPEQADLVERLAFADPTDYWGIDKLVIGLMSESPDALLQAARTWRCLLLEDLIQDFSESIDRFEAAADANGEWLDDLSTSMWDFSNLWEDQEAFSGKGPTIPMFRDVEPATNSNHLYPTEIAAFRQFVQDHQKWLTEEKIALTPFEIIPED